MQRDKNQHMRIGAFGLSIFDWLLTIDDYVSRPPVPVCIWQAFSCPPQRSNFYTLPAYCPVDGLFPKWTFMQFLAPKNNSRYETVMIKVDFEYQFVNQCFCFRGVVFYFNHHVYIRFRRSFAPSLWSVHDSQPDLGSSLSPFLVLPGRPAHLISLLSSFTNG